MPVNGAAAFQAVTRLGDLTPEMRPFAIDRDGTEVTLYGAVKGKRTLLQTAVEYSAARDAWFDARLVRDEQGEPKLDAAGTRLYRTDDTLWVVFLAQALQIVIAGLTEQEALILAFDQDRATAILTDLGWFPKPEEADPDGEAGEAKGEDAKPTGAASSPSSASTSTAVEPT